MKNNEKQIEEMAKEIFNTCAWRFGNPNDYKEVFNDIAEDLTKLNYRKLPEDSVVLSREEYERLKGERKPCNCETLVNQARKETAEKIIDLIKTFCPDKKFIEIITRIIVERFGVEIKE